MRGCGGGRQKTLTPHKTKCRAGVGGAGLGGPGIYREGASSVPPCSHPPPPPLPPPPPPPPPHWGREVGVYVVSFWGGGEWGVGGREGRSGVRGRRLLGGGDGRWGVWGLFRPGLRINRRGWRGFCCFCFFIFFVGERGGKFAWGRGGVRVGG